MPTRRLWTAEDEASLRKLVAERKSYEKIGLVLGRTAYAVKARSLLLGLRPMYSHYRSRRPPS